ncbi:hypothetical protein L2E82_40726 [Cichorium intybus]|uniref:Uncharacterized protein n=1 Tax=Cichorium intybus TaxID=13427 RepID=A0ACB9ALY4_CICIN|nr:hypothetical protein L2E82_40726 [Cichorium intybus]
MSDYDRGLCGDLGIGKNLRNLNLMQGEDASVERRLRFVVMEFVLPKSVMAAIGCNACQFRERKSPKTTNAIRIAQDTDRVSKLRFAHTTFHHHRLVPRKIKLTAT